MEMSPTMIGFSAAGPLLIFFAFFALFMIVALFASAHAMRENQQVRDQAAQLIETGSMRCSVCDSRVETWGTLYSYRSTTRFMPRGRRGTRPVVALRCEACGHLMLFSDPPLTLGGLAAKRKRDDLF
jgi:DNA-directed RNA polymerase subunit RPC12/RpoP